MRIGQLSSLAQVSTATIRFYEQQGLMPSAKRSSNGYRQYDQQDLQQLQLIKFCQTLGFSLQELPSMLPIEKEGHEEILSKLKQKQVEIAQLLAQVTHKKTKIDDLIVVLERSWQKGECLSPDALSAITGDV